MCTQKDMLKHGGQLLLLPQCVQVYCIAGLIHPGITSVWTDGLVWQELCGKRPKTPNNTNKTTSESRAGYCSQLLAVCSVLLSSWIEFTQDAWVCEQCGWFDIYDVETGVKHPTIQTKRPLKSWLAMAHLSTLFSVLTHSWVDSPRSHEFVNCESDWTWMLLKTA